MRLNIFKLVAVDSIRQPTTTRITTQTYLAVWVECLAETTVFSCVKMLSRLRCQRHDACQPL